MKNIVEMREQLSAMFSDLRSGAIEVKTAAEMNNTAGKIISSIKVQLDYAALRKEAPTIAYLGGEPMPSPLPCNQAKTTD